MCTSVPWWSWVIAICFHALFIVFAALVALRLNTCAWWCHGFFSFFFRLWPVLPRPSMVMRTLSVPLPWHSLVVKLRTRVCWLVSIGCLQCNSMHVPMCFLSFLVALVLIKCSVSFFYFVWQAVSISCVVTSTSLLAVTPAQPSHSSWSM